MKFAPEFVLNLPIIEVSMSLIGQKVKLILPNIRLHYDMKRTIDQYLIEDCSDMHKSIEIKLHTWQIEYIWHLL